MPDYDDITQDMLDHLIDLFEKKDFKSKLIKELNEDVNLPMINEKTEKKYWKLFISLSLSL